MKKYNFKKNNFTVIKKAISSELCLFIYNYFLLKKQVFYTMRQYNYLNPFDNDWGFDGDKQVNNAFAHYSDIVMETLLIKCQEIMEKNTGLKLFPTYSYARVYKKGSELVRHKDRLACEISTTMNLGGDSWPIFIEPNYKKGTYDNNGYVPSDSKGVKVTLNPGDMLVYKGNILEHWREPLKGEECVQVFLHYIDQKNKNSDKEIFDNRKHIGLPAWFKGKIN